MIMCHTVNADNNAVEKFQASSPDEYSFLKFCERLINFNLQNSQFFYTYYTYLGLVFHISVNIKTQQLINR
jgi:hypothetical protein